jgi:hypothetical protein
MKELFGLFAQIALSRKGPQDLPASYLVLALTVAGYWLIRFAVSTLAPPTPQWRLHLVVEILFALTWYAVLLRTVGRPERFVQTATAIFGAWILLGPPWVIAIHFSQTLPVKHVLYAPMALITLAIAIWIIRASSYVLKHALEMPIAACVLLTILQTFTGELLMRAVSPPQILTN